MNRVTSLHLPWFVLLAVLPLAGGCASQWEKHFPATEGFADRQTAAVERVEIRTVPFERIRKYEEDERQLQIDSPVAPADWDASQRREAKARLLRALQLQAEPDQVDVLGWSDFHTTQEPGLDSLRQFARKLGSDVVVVAEAPAGQVTTIQQQPVHSDQQGWVTPIDRRRRYAGGYFYSDRSTTWVPIAVTENQTYYQAFFLRRR